VLKAVPSVKRPSSFSQEWVYPYNASVLCIRSALKFCKSIFLVVHQSDTNGDEEMLVLLLTSALQDLCSCFFPGLLLLWALLLYRPDSPMALRKGSDPGSLSVSELWWCRKQMNYQEKSQRQKSGQSCCKMYLAAAMLTVPRGVTYWCYCQVTSQGVDKTELVTAREETLALCSSVLESQHLQEDAGRDFTSVHLVSRCWSTPGFWLLHCSKSGSLIESENPEEWEWLLLGTWTSLNRNFTAR